MTDSRQTMIQHYTGSETNGQPLDFDYAKGAVNTRYLEVLTFSYPSWIAIKEFQVTVYH